MLFRFAQANILIHLHGKFVFYTQAYAPTVLFMQKYKIGSEQMPRTFRFWIERKPGLVLLGSAMLCEASIEQKKNSIQESNPFSLTKKLVKKLIVQVGQRMERNIHWIEHYQVANSINCYGTVIYAVDIAIKPLNNWGLVSNQLYFLANKLKQVRSSGSILLPWREALSIRLTIKLALTGKIAETWVTSTNERARSPYFTLHASLQGHHILRHVCNTNTSWAKFYLSRQSFVLYFHVYSDTNIPLMATRFFPRKQISSA